MGIEPVAVVERNSCKSVRHVCFSHYMTSITLTPHCPFAISDPKVNSALEISHALSAKVGVNICSTNFMIYAGKGILIE